MKTLKFFGALLLIVSLATQAQDNSRALLERRIELAYAKASLSSADSPWLDHLLLSAKSANPDVDGEVWASIKPEFSAAANAVFLSNGGPFGGALHSALEKLEDSELEHLANVLEDPVLARFQSALSTPASQKKTMEAIAIKALLLGQALNIVLAKHGLREVH